MRADFYVSLMNYFDLNSRCASLIFLVFVALNPAVFGEKAVFSFVEGDEIKWQKPSAEGSKPIYPQAGEVFQESDLLDTGSLSRTEMTIPNEAIVRVGPYSRFFLQPRNRSALLRDGTMLLQKEPSAPDWNVECGGLVASLSGTTILFSRQPGALRTFYVLETSSVNGVKIRGQSKGTNAQWSLPAGTMLFEELADQSLRQVAVDPSLVWNGSTLGKKLEGNELPACTTNIACLTPPRNLLAWQDGPKVMESYPFTFQGRVDAPFAVDRFLLTAAYGSREEVAVMIREVGGNLSNKTDPLGNHAVSAALESGRMNLMPALLESFNVSMYQARGRRLFPEMFLAKSPLARALVTLTTEEFKNFLEMKRFNREEVLDAYAVGANFLLLSERQNPLKGAFYPCDNLITLASSQSALGKEENRRIIRDFLLPILVAQPGSIFCLEHTDFTTQREKARIPIRRRNPLEITRNPPPNSSVESGSNPLSDSLFLQDNFHDYWQGQLNQRPVASESYCLDPGNAFPRGAVLDLVTFSNLLLSQGSRSLPNGHLLALASWASPRGSLDRPVTFRVEPPKMSTRLDDFPVSLRKRAEELATLCRKDFPWQQTWVLAGQLAVPPGEKRMAGDAWPDADGHFVVGVRESSPAMFYVWGCRPVLIPPPRNQNGNFGWLGNVTLETSPQRERAKIRGQVGFSRRPDSTNTPVEMKLQLGDFNSPGQNASPPPAPWTHTGIQNTLSGGGSFALEDLAPLPYQLILRAPGFVRKTINLYPAKGEDCNLGRIKMEKAPRLSFRHLERVRSPGIPWQSPANIRRTNILCDGENPLVLPETPSAGPGMPITPSLSLPLIPERGKVKAPLPERDRFYELPGLNLSGKESFSLVTANFLRREDEKRSSLPNTPENQKILLVPGRTYLYRAEREKILVDWMIRVE